MNAPKMAAVCESEYALPEFKCNVDVDAIFYGVGAPEQFFRVRKPNEQPVEPEMQRDQPSVQHKNHVFAFPFHALNAAIRCKSNQMRCSLWLQGNGMENVNATNALPLNKWPQRAYHSFDFGQFRHRLEGRSGTRLER